MKTGKTLGINQILKNYMNKLKFIAETAWHHEGDFNFMKKLVNSICKKSKADIVKLHITLDFDSYMSVNHPSYSTLKRWLFSKNQWNKLIKIIRENKKELMLLVNDIKAIDYASKVKPEYVEVHSVCLNVPSILETIKNKLDIKTKIVFGVGGSTIEEIDRALQYFEDRHCILMFGFQNYPTSYKDINLKKIKKIQEIYKKHQFGYADHTDWNHNQNQFITLLISSNNMDFVEKHITIRPGKKRTDFSAAVSINSFNDIVKQGQIVSEISGDGSLNLNKSEKSYSIFGPNKMTAVATKNISKGKIIKKDDFIFIRTGKVSNFSQLDALNNFGSKLRKDIKKNEILKKDHFA